MLVPELVVELVETGRVKVTVQAVQLQQVILAPLRLRVMVTLFSVQFFSKHISILAS
jgi:hypothetical protein